VVGVGGAKVGVAATKAVEMRGHKVQAIKGKMMRVKISKRTFWLILWRIMSLL
jgi:hypothetical protein